MIMDRLYLLWPCFGPTGRCGEARSSIFRYQTVPAPSKCTLGVSVTEYMQISGDSCVVMSYSYVFSTEWATLFIRCKSGGCAGARVGFTPNAPLPAAYRAAQH